MIRMFAVIPFLCFTACVGSPPVSSCMQHAPTLANGRWFCLSEELEGFYAHDSVRELVVDSISGDDFTAVKFANHTELWSFEPDGTAERLDAPTDAHQEWVDLSAGLAVTIY